MHVLHYGMQRKVSNIVYKSNVYSKFILCLFHIAGASDHNSKPGIHREAPSMQNNRSNTAVSLYLCPVLRSRGGVLGLS